MSTHAHETYGHAKLKLHEASDRLQHLIADLENREYSKWRLAIGLADHDPTAVEIENLTAKINRINSHIERELSE